MKEFDSEMCVNKLLQGCQYTAGKCPCRLKKTASEEEYDRTEKYVKTHWKSVVLCSECKHRDSFGCPMRYEYWDQGFAQYMVKDRTCDDGWCFKGERE